MDKLLNTVNNWLTRLTNLLLNVLSFAVVCGLLFDDPFGIIEKISVLISGVGERGVAGFIALAILVLVYRRK